MEDMGKLMEKKLTQDREKLFLLRKHLDECRKYIY